MTSWTDMVGRAGRRAALGLVIVTVCACASEPLAGDLDEPGSIELAITGTAAADVAFFHFQADSVINATASIPLYNAYLPVTQVGGQPRLQRSFALPANQRVRFALGFAAADQSQLGEQKQFDYVFARGERLRYSNVFDTNPGAGTIGVNAAANSAPMIDELQLPPTGSLGSTGCLAVNQIEDFDDTAIFVAFRARDVMLSMSPSPAPDDAGLVIQSSVPATQCFGTTDQGVHALDACACDSDWCECSEVVCNFDSLAAGGIAGHSCEIGNDGVRIYRFDLDTNPDYDLLVREQRAVPGGPSPGVIIYYDADGAPGAEATLDLPDEEIVSRDFPPQNLGSQTVFKLLTRNPTTGQVTEYLFTGAHATGAVSVTSSVVTPAST